MSPSHSPAGIARAAAVIVGAGPGGTAAALRLAQLGVHFVPRFRAKAPITRRDAAGRTRWAGVRAADGREIGAQFVVVADGAHSTLTTVTGRKRTIHTIMGWWENVEYRPNHVEMLWDESVRPCYGWLFPETERRVNIGITYDDDAKVKNARALFHTFLERHFEERLARATQVGRFRGHPIVYCYRPRQLTAPGRIAIGEAGRMTHPATGEGIYQAMHSGVLAAEAIESILAGRSGEARALAAYEQRVRRRFTPSFCAGAAFRGLLRTPLFDAAVKLGSAPRLRRARPPAHSRASERRADPTQTPRAVAARGPRGPQRAALGKPSYAMPTQTSGFMKPPPQSASRSAVGFAAMTSSRERPARTIGSMRSRVVASMRR